MPVWAMKMVYSMPAFGFRRHGGHGLRRALDGRGGAGSHVFQPHHPHTGDRVDVRALVSGIGGEGKRLGVKIRAEQGEQILVGQKFHPAQALFVVRLLVVAFHGDARDAGLLSAFPARRMAWPRVRASMARFWKRSPAKITNATFSVMAALITDWKARVKSLNRSLWPY